MQFRNKIYNTHNIYNSLPPQIKLYTIYTKYINNQRKSTRWLALGVDAHIRCDKNAVPEKFHNLCDKTPPVSRVDPHSIIRGGPPSRGVGSKQETLKIDPPRQPEKWHRRGGEVLSEHSWIEKVGQTTAGWHRWHPGDPRSPPEGLHPT